METKKFEKSKRSSTHTECVLKKDHRHANKDCKAGDTIKLDNDFVERLQKRGII